MMWGISTDLAAEAHCLWRDSAEKTSSLPGVRARSSHCGGLPLTRVDILSPEGAAALHKAQGTYLSLELSSLSLREEEDFRRGVLAVARLVGLLAPQEGPLLVVGLGNRQLTVDALGPLTVDKTLVTRHLTHLVPDLRPVSALAAGVKADTGMEAGEWLCGAVQTVQPAAVLAVDALAAGSIQHLATVVQLSNGGIIPGSGVGNHRSALDQSTLGVPVLALGVPTIADASGLQQGSENLLLTVRDIDHTVALLARLLGLGITLGTQRQLTYQDAVALSR